MHNAAQNQMAGQTGASSPRLTGTEAVLDRVPHRAPSQVKVCLQTSLQASKCHLRLANHVPGSWYHNL